MTLLFQEELYLMRFLDHIKLAGFTGLTVGMLFGVIDSMVRVMAWSFEWFELYQTLLVSAVLATLGFVIVGIFIELFGKALRLNFTKKNLLVFYVVSSILVMLLVYGEIFINFKLFDAFTRSYQPRIVVSLLFPLIVGLIYIALLTKGKEIVLYIVNYTQRKKLKVLAKNFIFVVLIFIITSFLVDIYFLNSIQNYSYNKETNEVPNVVFITLDTVRADHLSLYGYYLNTSPNIDNLAKDSVVFDNAVSPSPWTLPSHASFFSGKYLFNHNATIANQHLDNTETTLAEILRAKGYNTAGFVGGPYTKKKYGIGQGFETYKDRIDFFEYVQTFNNWGITYIITEFFPGVYKILGSDGFRSSEDLNKDIFAWLDKNSKQSFFMFINYFDAHDPYNLGSEFRDQFVNETKKYPDIDLWNFERYKSISEDTIYHLSRLYDTEIFFLDYHLGKFVNKLDELGIKNNTIIIITADHGEEFYDHGGFLHTQTLYEEVIHVPLIIYYPKEFKSKSIHNRVEAMAIFPTILDILDVEIPRDIDATSLLPLINNEQGYNKKYAFSELFSKPRRSDQPISANLQFKSISDDNWKIIEAEPNIEILPPSLFNLKTDPREQKNFYDVYPNKRKELQKLIASLTEDDEQK
ncbi:hypothetical protein CMO94_00110 [Candidatus Woesearchaeota archaeon]|nr:hypothetical protein [Candidatus Woesearchaeota archaeon]